MKSLIHSSGYISNLTHLKTLDLSNNNKTEFGVIDKWEI